MIQNKEMRKRKILHCIKNL